MPGLTPSPPEVGDRLCLPLLQRGDLGLQPLQLAADARQLRLRLLILQVLVPMLLLDQRFDLSTEEPQEGVPVDRVKPVVERASPDSFPAVLSLSVPPLRCHSEFRSSMGPLSSAQTDLGRPSRAPASAPRTLRRAQAKRRDPRTERSWSKLRPYVTARSARFAKTKASAIPGALLLVKGRATAAGSGRTASEYKRFVSSSRCSPHRAVYRLSCGTVTIAEALPVLPATSFAVTSMVYVRLSFSFSCLFFFCFDASSDTVNE